MEIKECIETRRSIRKFNGSAVLGEDIEKMVKASQCAPSWKNSQTARFYCALSSEAVSKVNACLPDFNAERTQGVGAYIITTVNKGLSGCDGEGNYFSHLGNGYECFDNGLAVENMILTAHSLGYATLIMGLFDEKALRSYLGVPSGEDIVTVVAVGKTDKKPNMPERKPLEEVLKIF